MKKTGKIYSLFIYFFLLFSLFFLYRGFKNSYFQKKIVNQKISQHIDLVERKFSYYLSTLHWKQSQKNSTEPIIQEDSLFLFKKEGEIYYQCEIKNYYQIFSFLFDSISTDQYLYPFIVTDNGRYIYHPNSNLLKETLFSEARADKDRKLFNMAKLLVEEKPQKYIGKLQNNKMTAQNSRVEYRKIDNYNIYLGIVSVDEKSDFTVVEDLKKDIYFFILTFTVFLLLILVNYLSIKKIFLVTFGQFCIFLSLITMINYSSSKEDMKDFSYISSQKELFKFLNTHNLSKEGDIYIQIQDIDFLSNNNIRISGFLEYSKVNFDRVYFPDSTEYSESILKDKNNIVTKKFSFILSEDFQYYKYPLESNIISIKMTTWNDEKSTVLTPNFSKYSEKLLISSKWGLTKNISINAWDILGSFFSYEEVENNNYNLTFNIYVKRNILAPFISNLLPFFVIIGLLFILILLTPKNKEQLNMDFFLGSISGLFFTTLLSQNSLRKDITTDEILYLDYFYFFLYFILIAIIVLIFMYKTNSINYKIIKKLKLYFNYSIFFILTIITFLNFPL